MFPRQHNCYKQTTSLAFFKLEKTNQVGKNNQNDMLKNKMNSRITNMPSNILNFDKNTQFFTTQRHVWGKFTNYTHAYQNKHKTHHASLKTVKQTWMSLKGMQASFSSPKL